jgi:lipoprotein-releasing system permease protein
MSFEWFVARRYLTARRRQALVSLISGVSILGVTVGVMALIIALALMTGVQSELRDRIVGSTAHVYVYRVGGTYDNVPAAVQRLTIHDVRGVAPAIIGPGLLTSTHADTAYAQIKGVDPALEPRVTDITRATVSGSLAALGTRPAGAPPGVMLGADLAQQLGVTVGDTVTLVTPQGTLTPFGPVPHHRLLEVVGTFRFGFYELDTAEAIVTLQTAEDVLNRAGPDMMQVRLASIDEAPAVHEQLQTLLGPDYLVQDWTQVNGPLYSALWLEKMAISAAIGLIVLVAALNIVASLVLLVMEKSRDIAILRTMGASARSIRRIFIYQGLTIGLVGTGAGTVLGITASLVADHYRLIRLSAQVYQITYLPFHVLPLDVTIVVLAAVGVCFLATIYPSRQAGRLDPAEALRNE